MGPRPQGPRGPQGPVRRLECKVMQMLGVGLTGLVVRLVECLVVLLVVCPLETYLNNNKRSSSFI